MVDATILIDYFRKTDKKNSRLIRHFQDFDQLFISSITEFEVINGATLPNLHFWDEMIARFTILDFDSQVARQAVKIVQLLKPIRKSIDKPDLFIAATAVAYDLTLDTTNRKHFKHISILDLHPE